MTNSMILTGTWQQFAAGKTYAVVQATDLAEVHVGASAPAASAAGFRIKYDAPHGIPNLDLLGGGGWVRGNGVFLYATD